MSLWVTILIGTLWFLASLAGLFVLCLALFHVRYDIAWFGVWTGVVVDGNEDFFPHEKSVRLEFGFPGFMKTWDLAGRKDQAAETGRESAAQETVSSQPPRQATPFVPPVNPSRESGLKETEGIGIGGEDVEPGFAEPLNRDVFNTSATAVRTEPPPRTEAFGDTSGRKGETQSPPKDPTPNDPNRARKSLFRFATDGPVWKALFGYGFRVLGRALRLLHARVELSAGHPDPAFLGRMAGHWYAISPLLPTGRTTMNFRFQDRHPSFGARVSGGFSLLSLLLFAGGALLAFPVFRLGRRAWWVWRNKGLVGWRAWVYRKIQTL